MLIECNDKIWIDKERNDILKRETFMEKRWGKIVDTSSLEKKIKENKEDTEQLVS